MFIRLTAALAASCCLLGAAQANQIGPQLNIQCTGSLGIMGIDGLSMRCEGGDLSLHGMGDDVSGLSSDIGIDLFASGRLDLQRVALSAPVIQLNGQDVVIGDQAMLNASESVAVNAGSTSAGLTLNPRHAIHNWQTVDIGAGANVVVNSGSSNADLAVFRVVSSQNASALDGRLRSSGQIVIVNRNGIDLSGMDGDWLTIASATSPMAGTITAVPEPSALGLFGLGLLGILAAKRPGRRR